MGTSCDLLFLGPPGAGKGTQAKRLCGAREIPHVSTGDLFRAAIKNGTELGRQAQEFMKQGLLVPDEVTCGMVRERLAEPDAGSGFVLDGFPRTIPQAEALEALLSELGRGLKAVVSFELDQEVLVDRLSGRLTCKNCGAQFHLRLHPPREEGVCDACGQSELDQREDDRPEAIRKRMKEYQEKTAPLTAFYEERGLVAAIDADASMDEVASKVRAIVDGHCPGA